MNKRLSEHQNLNFSQAADSVPLVKGLLLGILISGLLIFSGLESGWAQEVRDFNQFSSTTEMNRSKARAIIIKSAIRNLSNRLVREILGDENFKLKYKKIEKKILKESRRYVLSQRSSGLKLSEDKKTYSMGVDLKVSIKNLRALLLSEGLLYAMDSLPTILPMVSFKDRVNLKSISWWAENPQKEQAAISNLLRRVHEAIHKNMFKKGFYVLSPLKSRLHNLVPTVYRQNNISNSEARFLGQYFGSSIVLRGQIVMTLEGALRDHYRVAIRMEAYQTNNGRIIAEVIRNYITEVGAVWAVVDKKISETSDQLGSDLAIQVEEAWKRGTIGSSLLKVTFNGKFNYRIFSKLKNVVRQKMNEIRIMRERRFDPNAVVFEMDVSTGADKLAEAFDQRNFAPFRIKVERVAEQSVDLSVTLM